MSSGSGEGKEEDGDDEGRRYGVVSPVSSFFSSSQSSARLNSDGRESRDRVLCTVGCVAGRNCEGGRAEVVGIERGMLAGDVHSCLYGEELLSLRRGVDFKMLPTYRVEAIDAS